MNAQNIVNFNTGASQNPDSLPAEPASSPKSPHKPKEHQSICRIPAKYRWHIEPEGPGQFSVEQHLHSHWHLYNAHSLPRSYIIDSDDQSIQAIFKSVPGVWDQMTAEAYSIDQDFVSPEERKDIEELGTLNSINSLEQYLKENPLDPCDTSLKPYLFSVVYKLCVHRLPSPNFRTF